MPLKKSCSIDAFENNIAAEINAGKSREQAVAIAHDTLRQACRDEGKPVPTKKALASVRKQTTEKSAERTREFLEAALDRAKKVLNARDYAVIFQSARGSAGGKIKAKKRKDRLTATESVMVEKRCLNDLSNSEITSMAYTVNCSFAKRQKTGEPVDGVLRQAKALAKEMQKRKMELKGAAFKAIETVKKGFEFGHDSFGFHAHGLDRKNEQTLMDGAHRHVWQMPGTKASVWSEEDGPHSHVAKGEASAQDGAHSHAVYVEGSGVLKTKLDGPHVHSLMLETTGFDGTHSHVLTLADGTELVSLTPSQYMELAGMDGVSGNPLPFASEILGALNELRALQSQAEWTSPMEVSQAVYMTLDGTSPKKPTLALELCDGVSGFELCTADGYPVLTVAKSDEFEVGDIIDVGVDLQVIGFSKHVEADEFEYVNKTIEDWQLIAKHTRMVPVRGPKDAKVLFLASSPSELECVRKEALVGDDGLVFKDLYLKTLGLKPEQIAKGFLHPTLPLEELDEKSFERWKGYLTETFKNFPHAKVVTLGKAAKDALKDSGVEFIALPHPSAVRKKGDSGEVRRKLKPLAKSLDVFLGRRQDAKHVEPSKGSKTADLKSGRDVVKVAKSLDEKQIVYGVVLDPYDVDLQDEWVPPATVESTSHGFLKMSRVIGLEHMEKADAKIVESWVEPYPSVEDYQAAMKNLPHRAFRRKFGTDYIHSGTWVAGVQLGDAEWAAHKKGELNSFSVGGFSYKTEISTEAMPKVEFIDLVER